MDQVVHSVAAPRASALHRMARRWAQHAALLCAGAAGLWSVGSIATPTTAHAGDVGIVVVTPGVRIIVGEQRVRRFGGDRFFGRDHFRHRSFRSDHRRFDRRFDGHRSKRSWKHRGSRFDHGFSSHRHRFDRRGDRGYSRSPRFRTYRYKQYFVRGGYRR